MAESMSESETEWSPDDELLRRLLVAAQDGQEGPYRRVLRWTAIRARSTPDSCGDAETTVQATLCLLHALRHTYDPARSPVAWIDSLIAAAADRKAAASVAARLWSRFRPREAA
jgi:hypothetical protein